jgi:5-methylcytosine-specific restriction endonuclease McrA
MCRGAVMGLETTTMDAVGWDEWINLPIREGDKIIKTVHRPVRVPTVILCVSYAGRKEKRPRLTREAIRRRDASICQITGVFAPDGNVDHGVPRSRGGKDTWENLRWMRKDLNAKKGSRTLDEMGWRPIRHAEQPKPLRPEQWIEPQHPDWTRFLSRKA